MTRLVLAGPALVLAAGLAAAPALAQQPICAPREQIVATLEKTYREARRAIGLQNAGAVLEIYASEETGTWTIVLTRPDGVSCAMASGEAWREEEGVILDPPV